MGTTDVLILAALATFTPLAWGGMAAFVAWVALWAVPAVAEQEHSAAMRRHPASRKETER